MVKIRLIPCLLLKDGLLVRSERFTTHQIIGDPIHEVERFNQWAVDELIYLDISENEVHDTKREDVKVRVRGSALEILEQVSKTCFMPLTFGGRIRSVEDMRSRIQRGADKITINTMAVKHPRLISEGAQVFGSQCIVVSIDVQQHPNGAYEVVTDLGKRPTGLDPVWWAKEAERLGAGEIFLNSVDRDGTAQGYDLTLIRSVAEATTIPVIACGGAGSYQDFVAGITDGRASAVSAANIFHFKELSDRQAKKAMAAAGLEVRV